MMRPQIFRRLRFGGGVSVVTAIFVVVVLAALGTAIVSLSTAQQVSSVLDLLGSRAYEAARSGIEYGVYRRQQANSCPAAVSFAPGGGQMTVTVQCTVTSTAGMPSLDQVTIRATACNIPASGACPNAATTSADYVQRVVVVQF
jgi:MSHA biogenesis protein MshP